MNPEPLHSADRDARVEELLLAGLDHYFAGQYDLAINVWTRVLFLDRGHARARAYIERARGAIAERQREADELVHRGAEAIDQGDPNRARELLTSAVDRGTRSEEALALLQRLDRIEAASAMSVSARADRIAPEAPAPGEQTDRRFAWVFSGVLLGLIAAATILLWAVGAGLHLGNTADTTATVPRAELPLPVPSTSDIAIARARSLAANGRLHDALAALESVRPEHPSRGDADALRAEIQKTLLDAARGTRRAPETPSAGSTR